MSNQLGSTPGGVEVATTPGGASGGGGGGVTSVTASSPLASSGGATPNITLGASGATAGSYTNVSLTVTAKGLITSIANGSAPVTAVTGTAPIVSSGGATPAISIADTAVTPGSYTSTNLTVDAKGRITAAANGSSGGVTSVTGTAPIVSSGGATPAISINNAGTTAGRAALERLIDEATVTGTSYTAPSFAGTVYGSLRFEIICNTAGADFTVTLPGCSGTYTRTSVYALAGTAQSAVSASWLLPLGPASTFGFGRITCKAAEIKTLFFDYYYGSGIIGSGSGVLDDATNAPTGFVLTVGASSTFVVRLYGVPI